MSEMIGGTLGPMSAGSVEQRRVSDVARFEAIAVVDRRRATADSRCATTRRARARRRRWRRCSVPLIRRNVASRSTASAMPLDRLGAQRAGPERAVEIGVRGRARVERDARFLDQAPRFVTRDARLQRRGPMLEARQRGGGAGACGGARGAARRSRRLAATADPATPKRLRKPLRRMSSLATDAFTEPTVNRRLVSNMDSRSITPTLEDAAHEKAASHRHDRPPVHGPRPQQRVAPGRALLRSAVRAGDAGHLRARRRADARRGREARAGKRRRCRGRRRCAAPTSTRSTSARPATCTCRSRWPPPPPARRCCARSRWRATWPRRRRCWRPCARPASCTCSATTTGACRRWRWRASW